MRTIGIFNCKGGVGKTTTAINLAAAYARTSGQHALLVDFDPQCHLTSSSGLKNISATESVYSFFLEHKSLAQLMQPWSEIGHIVPSHGQLMKLDAVLGRGPAALQLMGSGIRQLSNDDVDQTNQLVIIDCCPYIGVLSLNAIFAADALIIPVSADYLSFLGAKQVDKTLNALEPILKRRVPRRYVMTRYDRRRCIGEQIYKQLKDAFLQDTCETVIGENVSISESPMYCLDIFSYAPDSRGADDYQKLYQELMQQNILTTSAPIS